jgi:aminoglycoside phosphotransferase (APT) family kinase protein
MRSPSKKSSSAKQVDRFRRLARNVVEHHFGSRPALIKYKSGGLSNYVFEAKHKEGDFIVRISPDQGGLNAFIKEHWCEQAARRAGVPTAEILETGTSVIPFPYVIARSVSGIQAEDHPDRGSILRELGKMAAKINGIATQGFGETFGWSNNELSLNKTIKEYLENEYCYEGRIETLARSHLFPAASIKSLRQIFRSMLRLRAKPTLNHGDIRLKNVLVDDKGKIAAIIDWEKATSNIAPYWEFSVALHDLGIDEKQEFINGYGIKPKKLEEAAPFIKAFNLLNYVDEINRVKASKDKKAMDQLRMRFNGLFDLYSI